MKKILLAWTLLLPLAALAGERSFKDWLKDLDARIRQTERRRAGQLTAAASVRGAQEGAAAKLYWKGRKTTRPLSEPELDAFKKAVALAQDGKSTEAKAALESFLKDFPDTPLEKDARETLAYLTAPPQP
jgi:TolA-binding protein